MGRYLLSVILFGFGISCLASAKPASTLDELKKSLAICASTTGELLKLDCYSQLARQNSMNKTETIIPSQSSGAWIVKQEIDQFDDTEFVSVHLVSDTGKGVYGGDIILGFACMSNETRALINWESYLGTEANVLIRIGSDKAITREWDVSNNGQATIYPVNTIDFILEVMASNKFIAKVTPYSESTITAIFDTTGLINAIQPLRKSCGW